MLITGDTHGMTDAWKFEKYIDIEKIEENNKKVLIIAGDSGIIWYGDERDNERIEYYDNLPFKKILFIDGNHDNHTVLNAMKVEEWNGGKVHKITDKIYHLMRGQIFKIEGKKIFTFGGADSIDKDSRVEGKTWWKEERPTNEDF